MVLTLEQKQEVEAIGRKYDLKLVLLHGSYATKTPRRGSDLDIAILGRRHLSLDDILKIHAELAKIFGDNKARELDLKSLHGVDPLFRFEALRNSLLLYGNPTDYEEFKIYAYRDYEDSHDLRKLERVLLEKSIRALADRYAR